MNIHIIFQHYHVEYPIITSTAIIYLKPFLCSWNKLNNLYTPAISTRDGKTWYECMSKVSLILNASPNCQFVSNTYSYNIQRERLSQEVTSSPGLFTRHYYLNLVSMEASFPVSTCLLLLHNNGCGFPIRSYKCLHNWQFGIYLFSTQRPIVFSKWKHDTKTSAVQRKFVCLHKGGLVCITS